jgi:hypothetical protein
MIDQPKTLDASRRWQLRLAHVQDFQNRHRRCDPICRRPPAHPLAGLAVGFMSASSSSAPPCRQPGLRSKAFHRPSSHLAAQCSPPWSRALRFLVLGKRFPRQHALSFLAAGVLLVYGFPGLFERRHADRARLPWRRGAWRSAIDDRNLRRPVRRRETGASPSGPGALQALRSFVIFTLSGAQTSNPGSAIFGSAAPPFPHPAAT